MTLIKGLTFMQNNTINAVNSMDIEQYLDSIGELEYFKRGECKCHFCSKLISANNIYSVFPDVESSKVCYCCSDLKCVLALADICDKEKK